MVLPPTRIRAWHSRLEVELRVMRVWTLANSQGLGDSKRRASLPIRRTIWSFEKREDIFRTYMESGREPERERERERERDKSLHVPA